MSQSSFSTDPSTEARGPRADTLPAPSASIAGPRPPQVLELRVHGVNNTTPAALLDLPDDQVMLKSGDKLGSFWQPTPAAGVPAEGRRGHIPAGITREAYSWGGMVRTSPNFGGVGAAGTVAGVIARIFYALILPFSIGNAVQWTRRLTAPGDSRGRRAWTAVASGLSRLFGVILTLLFTTTVVTLAIDIGALQCGAVAARCEPLQALFAPMEAWTPGQRVALLALVPVAAIVALWVISAVSRLRYDVLPGMEGNTEGAAASESADLPTPESTADPARPVEPAPPAAVLSQPGFWSNRVVRHLSRVHLAAAVSLVAAFAAAQGSMGWRTTCDDLDLSAACMQGADDGWFVPFAVLAVAAGILLLASAALAIVLPTMRIEPEEERRATWPNWASIAVLLAGSLVLAVVLALLAFGPTAPGLVENGTTEVDRLYGVGMTPLVLAVAGSVLALSGVFWRPWADRWKTAWSGCGPAVFMVIALAVGIGSSAIAVVTVGDWLNGSKGPTALLGWTQEAAPASGRVEVEWTDTVAGTSGDTSIGEPAPDVLGLEISRSYVALGALILVGLVAALVFVLAVAFLRPRNVTGRAEIWQAPPAVELAIPEGGVLRPSPTALLARIEAKRRSAARLHLVEPAVAVISTTLAASIVVAIVWTMWATTQNQPLWGIATADGQQFLVDVLDIGMLGLVTVGALLVAVLAAGATSGGTRPLGIVWDIACYLPQTGHPFGPPCYAERAVPEIAGRLNAWLRRPERRAVLAAHSMGGVLAVSSLGLLSSTERTRALLPRISLLTFGVQLRPFFGRMLPELLGPDVLGGRPSRRPRLWAADPWKVDFDDQELSSGSASASTETPAVGRLDGTLVSDGAGPGTPVRWVSLWRLTDYLGYPAMSTAISGADAAWHNDVDRFADELDKSGYMVAVGTHGEYYRVKSYDDALRQLAGVPPWSAP
ncbi:MAG: hypothetical protein ABWY26_01195 [Microbacterium sp.]